MPTNEGPMEAVTSALGEALSELHGYRFTRLRTTLAEGATTADVETVLNWPTSGKVVIDGVHYTYSGIGGTTVEPTLTGLQYDDSTGTPVNGAKQDHLERASVLDYSQTFSAIDLLRNSIMVDTAVGDDLSTVGRNVAVDRPPGLSSDIVFRAVIKALAYMAKGSMYALETALTAFFGAGNFQIIEDFPEYNNRVFITLLNAVGFSTTPDGRAFLSYNEPLSYNSGTKVVTLSKSTANIVEGIRLKDEDFLTDFSTQKPSVEQEIRYSGDSGIAIWTFNGTDEVNDVTVLTVDDGVTEMLTDPFSVLETTSYTRLTRIRPESRGHFGLQFAITNAATVAAGASNGRQWSARIRDDARELAWGVIGNGANWDLGFINASGTFLDGAAVTLSDDVYYDVEIVKDGENDVELRVNGEVVQTLAYTSFPASSGNNDIEWGVRDPNVAGMEARVRYASCFFRTATDYWNSRGTSGAVLAAAAQTFDSNSAGLLAGDVGKAIRVYDGTTTNAQGGTNNGRWAVATFVDSDRVTVSRSGTNAFTESGNPGRITVANQPKAFRYPEDLGKRITLTGGTLPGPHTITAIIDPLTDAAFGDPLVPEFSNEIEVSGAPAFTTQLGLPWILEPIYVDETGLSWELSDAGTLSGVTATLRDAIPLNGFGATDIIVDATYTVVESAQVLEDATVDNDPVGSYFAFYLGPDPLGPYAAFRDDLTVAGVIPEIDLG